MSKALWLAPVVIVSLTVILGNFIFSPDDDLSPSSAWKPAEAETDPTPREGTTEVGLVKDSGTFKVPVTINRSIKLNFVLDSGASDVQIPADVIATMVRTGTLHRSDFLGRREYQLADGSTLPSYIFRIGNLRVGHVSINNVVGSISSAKGELLLGQSFLSRITSWSIDNNRRVLMLGSVKPGGDAQAIPRREGEGDTPPYPLPSDFLPELAGNGNQ